MALSSKQLAHNGIMRVRVPPTGPMKQIYNKTLVVTETFNLCDKKKSIVYPQEEVFTSDLVILKKKNGTIEIIKDRHGVLK